MPGSGLCGLGAGCPVVQSRFSRSAADLSRIVTQPARVCGYIESRFRSPRVTEGVDTKTKMI
jgi:hypothetical protein